ncbi:MAG: AsmA-like C-terminal domain-containing protein [Pseudomonadota bacterium]
MTAKTLLKTITLLVLVFFLGIASLPLVLPRLVDTDTIRALIADQISAGTGTRITTKSIGFSMFPLPTLRISQMDIAGHGEYGCHLDSVVLYPDISRILTGKITIDKILIQGVTPQLPTSGATTHFPSALLPGALFLNPDLFWNLPSLSETVSIKVSGIRTSWSRTADLTVDISSGTRTLAGSLALSGLAVDSMDLKPLSQSLADTLSRIRTDSLNANFGYQSTGDLHVRISGKNALVFPSGNTPKPISADGFSGKLSLQKGVWEAVLNPTTLAFPSLTAGVLFRHENDTGNTDLVFSGNAIDLDQTREAALSLFKTSNLCRELFHILYSGTASDVSVGFHNTLTNLFDPGTMVIRGAVDQGTVNIPQTRLTVTSINGEASVDKGILSTSVSRGTVDGSTLSKGSLDIDLLHKDVPFTGEFVLHADLAPLPGVLMGLVPDSSLSRELGRLSDVQGNADGTLALNYDKNLLSVRVDVSQVTGSAAYDRVPQKLSVTGGQVIYTDEEIFLKGIQGSVGSSLMDNLTAAITLENDPQLDIQSLKLSCDLGQIFPWLVSFNPIREAVLPLTNLSGQAVLESVSLKGRALDPWQWQYDVHGLCEDLALSGLTHDTEIIHGTCFLDLTDKSVLVSGLSGIIRQSGLIQSVCSARVLTDLRLPVSLDNATLSTTHDQGNVSFSGNLTFDTGPCVALDASGSYGDISVQHLHLTDPGVTDADIIIPGNDSTGPASLAGHLDTDTLEKMILPGTPLHDKVQCTTRGLKLRIESSPSNELTVYAPALDMDTLMGSCKSSSGAPPSPGGKQYWPMHLRLKADSLTVDKRVLSPLDALLDRDASGMASIQVSETYLCNIKASGRILSIGDTLDLNLKLEARDADFKSATECLFTKPVVIDGPYSVFGNLVSQGDRTTFKENFSGSLSLTAGKGRIYKLTLLSRILSVINVSKFLSGKLPDITQDGFAYDSIDISAHLENSRIFLSSAVINGVDMTLLFSGWINPQTDTMDLICLVAPFKTADLVIKNIPVLGPLLNNRLISIPVKATGPIHDPVVTILPGKEISKGLMGTFERVIALPFTFLEKLTQDIDNEPKD